MNFHKLASTHAQQNQQDKVFINLTSTDENPSTFPNSDIEGQKAENKQSIKQKPARRGIVDVNAVKVQFETFEYKEREQQNTFDRNFNALQELYKQQSHDVRLNDAESKDIGVKIFRAENHPLKQHSQETPQPRPTAAFSGDPQQLKTLLTEPETKMVALTKDQQEMIKSGSMPRLQTEKVMTKAKVPRPKNVPSANEVLEQLEDKIRDMQQDHEQKVSNLRKKISSCDSEIAKLQSALIKQAQQQHHELEQSQKSMIDQGYNWRVLQIADMVTFMAQLLFKLTQMSCGFANNFAVAQNKLKETVELDKRKVNTEFAQLFKIESLGQVEFSETSRLQFDQNTQLLLDKDIKISELVNQAQMLAQKHAQSLRLLSEGVPDTREFRFKYEAIEKKLNFTLKYLEDMARKNSELLLTEILKCYRQPSSLEFYLRLIFPQLKLIDAQTKQSYLKQAQSIAAKEYKRQVPQKYEQVYSAQADFEQDFPQQDLKMINLTDLFLRSQNILAGIQKADSNIYLKMQLQAFKNQFGRRKATGEQYILQSDFDKRNDVNSVYSTNQTFEPTFKPGIQSSNEFERETHHSVMLLGNHKQQLQKYPRLHSAKPGKERSQATFEQGKVRPSSSYTKMSKKKKPDLTHVPEMLTASLFYAGDQMQQPKRKTSVFGQNKARIIGSAFGKTAPRQRQMVEQITVNGQIKYVRKFNDLQDQRATHPTKVRPNQRLMTFDQVYNKVPHPMDQSQDAGCSMFRQRNPANIKTKGVHAKNFLYSSKSLKQINDHLKSATTSPNKQMNEVENLKLELDAYKRECTRLKESLSPKRDGFFNSDETVSYKELAQHKEATKNLTSDIKSIVDANEKMYSTLQQKDIIIREALEEQERLKCALHEFKKTYPSVTSAEKSNSRLQQTQIQSSSALNPTAIKELEDLRQELDAEKMRISELQVVKEQLESQHPNSQEFEEIQRQLEALKLKNQELEASYAESERERKSLVAQMGTLKESNQIELNLKEKECAELREARDQTRQEADDVLNQLQDAKKALLNVEKQLENEIKSKDNNFKKERDEAVVKLSTIEDQMVKLFEQNSRAQEQIQAKDKELDELRASAKAAEAQIESRDKQLEEFIAARDLSLEQSKLLNAQIDDLSKQLKESEARASQTPEQDSNAVVEHSQAIEQKDKEIDILNKQKLALEDQLNAKDEELKETRNQLNDAQSRLSEIVREIDDFRENREKYLEQRLQEVEEETQKLGAVDLGSEVPRLDNQQPNQLAAMQIEEREKKITELEEKLSAEQDLSMHYKQQIDSALKQLQNGKVETSNLEQASSDSLVEMVAQSQKLQEKMLKERDGVQSQLKQLNEIEERQKHMVVREQYEKAVNKCETVKTELQKLTQEHKLEKQKALTEKQEVQTKLKESQESLKENQEKLTQVSTELTAAQSEKQEALDKLRETQSRLTETQTELETVRKDLQEEKTKEFQKVEVDRQAASKNETTITELRKQLAAADERGNAYKQHIEKALEQLNGSGYESNQQAQEGEQREQLEYSSSDDLVEIVQEFRQQFLSAVQARDAALNELNELRQRIDNQQEAFGPEIDAVLCRMKKFEEEKLQLGDDLNEALQKEAQLKEELTKARESAAEAPSEPQRSALTEQEHIKNKFFEVEDLIIQSGLAAESEKKEWSAEEVREKHTMVVDLLREYRKEHPDLGSQSLGTKERFIEITKLVGDFNKDQVRCDYSEEQMGQILEQITALIMDFGEESDGQYLADETL